MGGEETEVTETTASVLLEAANWRAVGILRASERLRLRTGLEPLGEGRRSVPGAPAAQLATRLILESSGARWVGEGEAIAELPPPPRVHFRPRRADAVIGLEVEPGEQNDILTSIGFEVAEDWNVTVPTWRSRDVTREIDLIEEVARFKLEEVPFTLPLRRAVFGRLSKQQRLRRLVEDVLVGIGFDEAYTWSLQAGDRDPHALTVHEPISTELAVLGRASSAACSRRRDTTSTSAPTTWRCSRSRVYLPTGEQRPDEPWRVAGVTSDGFFGAKGAVEALYDALKLEPRFERTGSPSSIRQGRTGGFRLGRGCTPSWRRRPSARSSSTSGRCSSGCPSGSSTRT